MLTCLVLPLVELIPVSLHAAKVRLLVHDGKASLFTGMVDVRGLQFADGIDPVIVRVLTTLTHIGVIDRRIAMIFDRSTRWLDQEAMSEHALETIHQTPFGLLIEGWMENVGRRDLIIMSGDLTAMAPVEDFLVFPRPDAMRLLQASAEGRSAGLMHGFMASLVGCGEKNRAIYVLERLSEGGVVIGPIAYQPLFDRDRALEAAVPRIKASPDVTADQARGLLKPLVASPNPAIRGQVFQFGPQAATPRLSIIVPMSGEAIFLRSLLAQQDHFPDGVEWLFCLQASGGSRDAVKLLSLAEATMAQPVSLLEIDVEISAAQMFNRAASRAKVSSCSSSTRHPGSRTAGPLFVR